MMDGAISHDPETGDIIINDGAPPREGPIIEDHNANLAEFMEVSQVDIIGSTLTEEMAHDQNGRGEWETLAQRYIEALGIGPESKPDDYEYEFSDTSNNTLLLKATTTFQAKALAAMMPRPDLVVVAEPDIDVNHIEDKKVRKEARRKLDEAAQRVQEFYTWYLLTALPSYVEDTDQIISDCGLQGAGFRRIVVDRTYRKIPVQPIHVPLEDLILSYDTKNFRGSGRVTHRYTSTTTDIIRNIQAGVYREVDLVSGVDWNKSAVTESKDRLFGIQDSMLNSDGSHRLYDVFTYLFLADDPHPQYLARPYVVTIHGATQTVLSIRRNWAAGDEEERPLEHFAGYIYSPGRNAASAIGLGALLTNVTLALRKAQRRALDAAYIANHPSGFVSGGISIRDDSSRIMPGELTPVDVANGDIRASILMNPFTGPGEGLLALYDRMLADGKELGSLASIDFASMMKSGVAAGPALAAYDESTEFQTSVHRRLYRGHSTELEIMHERMREAFEGQRVAYGAGKFLEIDDLAVCKIMPAMKPGHVSRQRAIIEAQTLMETADANPDLIDKREAVHRFLVAIGTHDIDTLMRPDPAEEQIEPTDPINEYMRLMRGDPLKAGPMQNHRAHIDSHVAQLSGIQTSDLPIDAGQAAAAALAAHIAEHEALDLAVQVAAATGIPLEMFMEGIPPEMEAEIAPMLAQAIQQVEAQRKPKDDTDPRVTIEQIRSENRVAIEQMKSDNAELQRQANIEIARLREEANTYRNITDNAYAIEIAELKLTGKPPSKPDIPSPPDLRANTPMPRFIMDP